MDRETILAMKPGRELDTLVAEKVMGWAKGFEDDGTLYWATGNGAMSHQWSPSKHMSAAWEVVEALRTRGLYVDVITYADFYQVEVHNNEGERLAIVSLPGLGEAISKAGLIATLEGAS